MNAYRGAVLIVSLLLLMMLTIIAVSQMSLNTTQTQMATNTMDAGVAFQTAEGAMEEATDRLLDNNYSPSDFMANTNGLYLPNASSAPLWSTIDWYSASAVIQSFKGNATTQAAYFIEQLPSIIKSGQNANFPSQVYRITVRAVGSGGSSVVMLQRTVEIQN